MNGYQITFFTQQDRHHSGQSMAEWLVHLASELKLRGATLIPATEGLGHDQKIHSARFFELADQPLAVLMVLSDEESDRLFQRLQAEKIRLFYVKSPAEFGFVGESP